MSEAELENRAVTRLGVFETTLLSAIIFLRLLISASVHPWSGYLLNAALGLLLLFIVVRKPADLRLPDGLLRGGLILYFSAGFISIPFSVMPWSSLRWFLFHTGDLFVFFTVLAAGKKRLPAIASAMLAAASVSAAFAVRQRLGGFALTMESEAATEYVLRTLEEGRVFGLTFSPDMLAAIIAGLIPVCLSFFIGKARGQDMDARPGLGIKLLIGIVTALFITVLFLTRSVGGYLAAGAGVTLWFIIHFRFRPRTIRPRQALQFAGIFSLIIAGAAVIVFLRGGHLLNLEDPHNPLVRRLDNWATGMRVWSEFPATGAGGGQYGLASLFHRSMTGNEAKHAHNMLVEALSETGPLGLIGACLILAGFFRGLIFSQKRNEGRGKEREGNWLFYSRANEIKAGMVAGGGAIALHSLIDFDLATLEVATVFWAALAASVMNGKCPALESPGVLEKRHFARLAVAAALVVAILAGLYQYRGSLLQSLAVDSARSGNWSETAAYAEKAIAWDGTNDEMHALLAKAVANSAQDKKEAWFRAREALEKAASLNPRYPFHYRDLGFLLLNSDSKAAGQAFQRAVELYPNSLRLNLHLGRWFKMEGRIWEAEKAFQHASRCHLDNGEALFELGKLYHQQEKYEKAAAFLERSAWARPVNSARALYFTRFLEGRSKRDELMEFLGRWMRSHPDDDSVKEAMDRLKKTP